MTHTPDHWTIKEIGVADAKIRFGAAHLLQGCRVYGENSEANARRIVQCVNSHDALVAALVGAEKVIAKSLERLPADGLAIHAGEWLIEIRAALAKAKGE